MYYEHESLPFEHKKTIWLDMPLKSINRIYLLISGELD